VTGRVVKPGGDEGLRAALNALDDLVMEHSTYGPTLGGEWRVPRKPILDWIEAQRAASPTPPQPIDERLRAIRDEISELPESEIAGYWTIEPPEYDDDGALTEAQGSAE